MKNVRSTKWSAHLTCIGYGLASCDITYCGRGDTRGIVYGRPPSSVAIPLEHRWSCITRVPYSYITAFNKISQPPAVCCAGPARTAIGFGTRSKKHRRCVPPTEFRTLVGATYFCGNLTDFVFIYSYISLWSRRARSWRRTGQDGGGRGGGSRLQCGRVIKSSDRGPQCE